MEASKIGPTDCGVYETAVVFLVIRTVANDCAKGMYAGLHSSELQLLAMSVVQNGRGSMKTTLGSGVP